MFLGLLNQNKHVVGEFHLLVQRYIYANNKRGGHEWNEKNRHR